MGQTMFKGTPMTFSVDLPFMKSEFEVLTTLGSYEKLTENHYTWTFPFAVMKEVEIALSGIVEFDQDFILKHILSKCPPLIEELEVSLAKKGKGEITVALEEAGYRVAYFEGGTEKSFIVSKALVEKLWFEVYAKLPKGVPTNSPTVQEKTVSALEKHHWEYPLFAEDRENKIVQGKVEEGWKHQKSRKFNPKYFFGDRKNYRRLFYCPVKVLVAMGLVMHTKDGKVVRIGNEQEFASQTEFIEVRLMEAAEGKVKVPSQPGLITSWVK